MDATTKPLFPHREPCVTIAHPLCRPTPTITRPDSGRALAMGYCICKTVIATMNKHWADHLLRKDEVRGFPLTASEVQQICTALAGQLPAQEPAVCCEPIPIWLSEKDVYAMQRWRYWMEENLATQHERAEARRGTILGVIEQDCIERTYAWLTRLRAGLKAT